jgi:hypothetical protein
MSIYSYHQQQWQHHEHEKAHRRIPGSTGALLLVVLVTSFLESHRPGDLVIAVYLKELLKQQWTALALLLLLAASGIGHQQPPPQAGR